MISSFMLSILLWKKVSSAMMTGDVEREFNKLMLVLVGGGVCGAVACRLLDVEATTRRRRKVRKYDS